MKSVVDADFSFRRFFTEKSAYIQNIGRNLRSAYVNYQESVARFPFDKLTGETRKSFESLIEQVDNILERGVLSGEVYALNYLWTAHPNTGIRGPKTPSEEHLEYTLRMSINQMQFYISVSDDECMAPLIPSMVPSFQPFTDAIVAAALDQIPKINDEVFKMSLQGEAESLAATTKFIGIIDACGSTPMTETCIKNFVSLFRKLNIETVVNF
jgi:hypothetical protein